MTDRVWSGEIDQNSGCRLPLPKREDLDADGQRVMDRQLDPNHGSLVGLRGPTGIRLHSPAIAEHNQALVAHFRSASILSKRTQEIAILVTARAHDNNFEWAAHEPAARQAGVCDHAITAIQNNADTQTLSAQDRLVIEIGRQLFGDRRLSDELYATAIASLGEKAMVELVSLMGMYAGTAYLLAAFDMQLPENVKPALG